MEIKKNNEEILDEDKVQQNMEAFIQDGDYSIDDVQNAYLGVPTDTNKKLLEIVQGALNKGFPMNRMGEIINKLKNNTETSDKYLTNIYSINNLDKESVVFLSKLPSLDWQGTCVFKVNGRPFVSVSIESGMSNTEKMQIITTGLGELKKFQGSFPLNVDFLENQKIS